MLMLRSTSPVNLPCVDDSIEGLFWPSAGCLTVPWGSDRGTRQPPPYHTSPLTWIWTSWAALGRCLSRWLRNSSFPEAYDFEACTILLGLCDACASFGYPPEPTLRVHIKLTSVFMSSMLPNEARGVPALGMLGIRVWCSCGLLSP